MEIKEWIMIISAIIVVFGWFTNSYLTRRNEISKKCLDYRLDTLHSFLPVYFSMTSSSIPFQDDPELSEKIKKAWINFQLYGHQDEVILINDFVLAIEDADTINATAVINKLIHLTRSRIREELKLSDFDLKSVASRKVST